VLSTSVLSGTDESHRDAATMRDLLFAVLLLANELDHSLVDFAHCNSERLFVY
jgi:hypothetical protein